MNMGMADMEMREKLERLHRESPHDDICSTRHPGGKCDCSYRGVEGDREPIVPSYEGAHQHIDKQGVAHWCFHKSRNLLGRWQFWAGMTMGFPVEHLLWEKLWPFYLLTHWWGL